MNIAGRLLFLFAVFTAHIHVRKTGFCHALKRWISRIQLIEKIC